MKISIKDEIKLEKSIHDSGDEWISNPLWPTLQRLS
jgi:hypothetical protein